MVKSYKFLWKRAGLCGASEAYDCEWPVGSGWGEEGGSRVALGARNWWGGIGVRSFCSFYSVH